MQIKILQLIEGAKQARGLAVIIDVFRAFSVACYLYNNGASRVIPVGELNTAYQLKKDNPDFILLGEREGKILPGFDYGNSPTHIKDVDFTGKTIVHTTSAGTQGIVNVDHAGEIITASFVNAGAVVRYINQSSFDRVSLVCMGNAGVRPADEDTMCAQYIKNRLAGKANDREKIVAELRKDSGKRFFDPANREWSPPADFDLCLKFEIFNFILKAEPCQELGKDIYVLECHSIK
ncbi:MAG: 2-phosphosulfolactate phosphatase [Halanaerobiales bacterium]